MCWHLVNNYQGKFGKESKEKKKIQRERGKREEKRRDEKRRDEKEESLTKTHNVKDVVMEKSSLLVAFIGTSLPDTPPVVSAMGDRLSSVGRIDRTPKRIRSMVNLPSFPLKTYLNLLMGFIG